MSHNDKVCLREEDELDIRMPRGGEGFGLKRMVSPLVDWYLDKTLNASGTNECWDCLAGKTVKGLNVPGQCYWDCGR